MPSTRIGGTIVTPYLGMESGWIFCVQTCSKTIVHKTDKIVSKHKTAALRAHEYDSIPEGQQIIVFGRTRKGTKTYPDHVSINFPVREDA